MMTLYATMFWSFSSAAFVETGQFVDRAAAQSWIERRVREEPHVYSGHKEPMPYIIEKDAR